jgi:hypothetical protein
LINEKQHGAASGFMPLPAGQKNLDIHDPLIYIDESLVSHVILKQSKITPNHWLMRRWV